MRDVIRMSHDEAAEFINEHQRAYVSTLNKDGSSHLVPVTYVVFDRQLTFWTDRVSQKTKNLERDPRITALVEAGVDFQELRAVQLVGTATMRDDAATSQQVAELFLARVPDEYKEMARATIMSLAEQRVVVSVVPDRTVSWDHRKMAGVKPQDVGH
jgi:PPOX class probable F420-dependent enzyme